MIVIVCCILLNKLVITLSLLVDNYHHGIVSMCGRFVAPLIPSDWVKECGIASANQMPVTTKSTQESKSILIKSVALNNILLL